MAEKTSLGLRDQPLPKGWCTWRAAPSLWAARSCDELQRRSLIETRVGAGTVVVGDVEANVHARQIDAEKLKARFAEEIGRLSGEAGTWGEAS